MRRILITLAVMFFMLAGFMSSCSNEPSKEKPQGMKGKKSLEEKSFAEEPKAPASALEGTEEGNLMDEEHNSSFE